MADVARYQEAIANSVLDSGQAISHRALASQVGGASATRALALAQFWKENEQGVGALHVAVIKATASKSSDPRARVIRLSTSPPPDTDSCIYGVYPSASPETDESTTDRVQEAMTLALWAQERKVRNDLFAGRSRHQPLTRELQAFYESDVQCLEATSRADTGDARGEEAISVFDSIKATAASSSTKSSFFKNSSSSTSASAATSLSSSKGSSSSSFFKSTSNGASTIAKSKSATVSAKPVPAEPKRIDASAMNNVLSVDSDSDEYDDDDAPKFVKKSKAATTTKTKRVMISDDEDEDFEQVSPPLPKKPTVASAKRKLSDSPESVAAKKKKTASPEETTSPRKREEEEAVQDEEPQAEEDPLPTGPIKRRQQVTKTTINDEGYMVTEKVYEEVEVSVEDLAKERAEAKKKQAAAKAAADAQKARAAAAAANSSKSTKGAAGPAKQKKLDFFFTRK
jgi:hypothetical protein